MTGFRTSFELAGRVYNRLFADWLHINFIIRTIILLMMLWIVIFIGALIFKYVIGPLAVLFYVNVIKRAWNFLITETIHEWLYIRYYSKGDSKFSNWYLRLSDRVKHNRAVLSYTRYRGILHRGRVRVLGNRIMITAAILAAMWVVAFGLNQEYAAPAWAAADGTQNDESESNIPEENEYVEEPNQEEDTEEPSEIDEPPLNLYEFISPSQFPPGITINLILTENVQEEGARLRDGPGLADTTVIEMLWGESQMTFLGHYVPDDDIDTLYWLRVRAPSGMEGYIGSQLVEVVQ